MRHDRGSLAIRISVVYFVLSNALLIFFGAPWLCFVSDRKALLLLSAMSLLFGVHAVKIAAPAWIVFRAGFVAKHPIIFALVRQAFSESIHEEPKVLEVETWPYVKMHFSMGTVKATPAFLLKWTMQSDENHQW